MKNYCCAFFASAREKELALVDWNGDRRRIFIETQFRAQQKHYQKHFPSRNHHIVMLNGKPVGMTDIARSAEEIRVLDIIILPEHRNRRIGTKLMQDLLAEADRLGKTPRLHVEKFSPALRFYARLGFTVSADTGVHYYMERLAGLGQTARDYQHVEGGTT